MLISNETLAQCVMNDTGSQMTLLDFITFKLKRSNNAQNHLTAEHEAEANHSGLFAYPPAQPMIGDRPKRSTAHDMQLQNISWQTANESTISMNTMLIRKIVWCPLFCYMPHNTLCPQLEQNYYDMPRSTSETLELIIFQKRYSKMSSYELHECCRITQRH